MDLRSICTTRFLAAVALLFFCSSFIACFDIPSDPSTQSELKSVTIQINQNDNIDTVILKIHPTDSAILSAEVSPKKLEKKLKFTWYRQLKGQPESYLGEGRSYSIYPYPNKDLIPNYLVVSDEENNTISSEFEIIINTPPKILPNSTPAEGDTLYGLPSKSFLFKWRATDEDNDNLVHSIIIDSTRYEIGDLTQLYQSGFSEGEHTYQIFVTDPYGDTDSTSAISFYVAATKKDEQ